jgi:general secretion pathway protein K
VPRPISFIQVDDLLAVPGSTPAVIRAIRDYVVFLPRATPVNANTAPAEVLSARLPYLSMADATALIGARRTASFRDLGDLGNRLPGRRDPPDPNLMSVNTSYFIVTGRVTIRQATLQVQALVERFGPTTYLLWVREV